jgi:hypothetical protein
MQILLVPILSAKKSNDLSFLENHFCFPNYLYRVKFNTFLLLYRIYHTTFLFHGLS